MKKKFGIITTLGAIITAVIVEVSSGIISDYINNWLNTSIPSLKVPVLITEQKTDKKVEIKDKEEFFIEEGKTFIYKETGAMYAVLVLYPTLHDARISYTNPTNDKDEINITIGDSWTYKYNNLYYKTIIEEVTETGISIIITKSKEMEMSW